MANTRFATDGKLGVVVDKAPSSTLSDFGGFTIGTRISDTNKGKEAILVVMGDGGLDPLANAVVSSTFTATTTTTGTWENRTGATAASGEYLWLVQESVLAN